MILFYVFGSIDICFALLAAALFFQTESLAGGISGFTALVSGGVAACICFGFAEVIRILLTVEENTRKTALSVDTLLARQGDSRAESADEGREAAVAIPIAAAELPPQPEEGNGAATVEDDIAYLGSSAIPGEVDETDQSAEGNAGRISQ